MKVLRIVAGLLFAAGLFAGPVSIAPASAQFFIKSYDFTGAPVTGLEPELGVTLPGATPTEVRAGLVWNLRAALNVAALQCDFSPMLLTVDNYNAMLHDHTAELKSAFDTLSGYFTRMNKSKAASQTALDRFGTRTYSAFATVSAQFNFCQTASKIGREVVFAPRGTMGDVAVAFMREMRNSLVPYGEQQFPRYVMLLSPTLPPSDASCWKRNVYSTGYCSAGKKRR